MFCRSNAEIKYIKTSAIKNGKVLLKLKLWDCRNYKQRIFMKKGIEIVIGIVIGVVITVILIIGLVVGGWFYVDRKSRETTQNEEQKKTEKASENKPNSTPADKTSEKAAGVTLENFNKISNGMTYEKVVEILGSKGKVMIEKEIAGSKNIVYMWEGERFTNITAMFVNGKLDSKNQIGLK
jgi:flagellar biosynthesis component FlhA